VPLHRTATRRDTSTDQRAGAHPTTGSASRALATWGVSIRPTRAATFSIWFSQPLVGAGGEASILLTAHNISGPSRDADSWHNAAAVASTYPMTGPVPILPDDGFSVGAVNVDNDGRAGFY
jgi:hypothetical protein